MVPIKGGDAEATRIAFGREVARRNRVCTKEERALGSMF
jgi:hypothetical protein